MKRPLDAFSYKGTVYGRSAVYDDDPAVKALPHLFEDIGGPKNAPEAPVERATARPGEKRTTKRAAKKATAGE